MKDRHNLSHKYTVTTNRTIFKDIFWIKMFKSILQK